MHMSGEEQFWIALVVLVLGMFTIRWELHCIRRAIERGQKPPR